MTGEVNLKHAKGGKERKKKGTLLSKKRLVSLNQRSILRTNVPRRKGGEKRKGGNS